MGVAFTREPFVAAWPGIRPLIDAHWQEVAYPGDTPPAPDVDAYAAAEAAGRLVVFTSRDDGVLIGYATFWIGPFPQRQGIIGAWQDAVYMTPEARANGIPFLRFCDDQLQALGVRVVHHSVREGHDFSPVLKRLGYVQAETVFAKHFPEVARG